MKGTGLQMKKNDEIYAIGLGCIAEDTHNQVKYLNISRVAGYYFEKEDAIGSVRKNNGDINEAGAYPYAIVERIEPGIYQMAGSDNRWLFLFNENTGEYDPVEFPEFAAHMCGFTIG